MSGPSDPAAATKPGIARGRLAELRLALGFLTVLPVGGGPGPSLRLAEAVWAFPLAGMAVGLLGGAAFALAALAGLGPWIAAIAAVAVQMLATGALHEDGLGDVADGFGGGAGREAKLAIMRDSRIGTFGVCALVIAVTARIAAVAGLGDGGAVVSALVASGALSRAVLAGPMRWLPAVRENGLGASAGPPSSARLLGAAVLGAAGAAILAITGGWIAPVAACVAAVLACAAVAALARRQIGGVTGDVFGAAQQAAEVAVLCTAVAAH